MKTEAGGDDAETGRSAAAPPVAAAMAATPGTSGRSTTSAIVPSSAASEPPAFSSTRPDPSASSALISSTPFRHRRQRLPFLSAAPGAPPSLTPPASLMLSVHPPTLCSSPSNPEGLSYFRVSKDGQQRSFDLPSANVLLAVTRLVAASMSRAAVATKAEAERKVMEAAVAGTSHSFFSGEGQRSLAMEDTDDSGNAASWSWEDNKLFEMALAVIDEGNPNRWEALASMIGGRKSAEEVKRHYEVLLEDLDIIESGRLDPAVSAVLHDTPDACWIDEDQE